MKLVSYAERAELCPDDGAYTFPDGLAPVEIPRALENS
jgi:hypothetical protein